MFFIEFNTFCKVVMVFLLSMSTMLQLKNRTMLVVIAARRSQRPPLSTVRSFVSEQQKFVSFFDFAGSAIFREDCEQQSHGLDRTVF